MLNHLLGYLLNFTSHTFINPEINFCDYNLYARAALPAQRFALALEDIPQDISSKKASISAGGNAAASTGQFVAHMRRKGERWISVAKR
jgi:hypothetical protein